MTRTSWSSKQAPCYENAQATWYNVEANKKFCVGCALGKAHRQSLGTRTNRPSTIGEQINADVFGPMTETSAGEHAIMSASKSIIRNFVVCSSSPQKVKWRTVYKDS
jgi:hypothetical protein